MAKTPALTSRLLDARPDRLDLRDLPYRPPLTSLPAQHPQDANLAAWLPAYVKSGLILNQGREGACTGFGLAGVVNYLLWGRRTQTKHRARTAPASVSARMLYELARRYDEWSGDDYDGSSCRGALKGWHRHGVCSEPMWPYTRSGRATFVPPRSGWERDALSRTLGVYYRVDHHSVVDMQAAIFNIGAIYVSASAHDGWDVLSRKTSLPAPQSLRGIPTIGPCTDETSLGGHAFAIVGYDAQGFIVQNSWGTTWGAAGFARLLYSDWVTNGTDAWACALGVPADPSPERVDSTRWRLRSENTVIRAPRSSRVAANPADDPWPIDHEFAYAAYQPLSTAAAYQQTLVTGNDGLLVVRDMTKGGPNADVEHAREVTYDLPLAWLNQQPVGQVKLAIYAHGGLNSEEESISRVRTLAPYFLANNIYPLFLTWRTGAGETLRDIVSDWFHKIPGMDEARAAGLGDWLADQKDRALEVIARPLGRGIWSEMRENAERSMQPGHGLDLLATNLSDLTAALAARGRALDVHLIGHSAGSILLGHFLERVMRDAGPAISIGSCSLFAPACSIQFANERYLTAAQRGVLPLSRLWLNYLSDDNERKDGLPSETNALYGRSLLYMVSGALDDERHMPLLGLARAHDPVYANSTKQWADDQLEQVQAWQAAWLPSNPGPRTTIVTAPTVETTKAHAHLQSTHGSFDNNLAIMTATLERISGAALVSPMEWLDY